MTFDELTALFRAEADDATAPYLFSDALVKGTGTDPGYLNAAYFEAVERAYAIRDKDTATCCTIAVISGTAEYALHASVMEIVRAKLSSKTTILEFTSVDELDATFTNWENNTGAPTQLLHDRFQAKLRLYPKPNANDTLNLTVYRRPLAKLSAGSDVPEGITTDHDQRLLLKWALYLAYSNHDADVYDPQRAQAYRQEFDAYFGHRHDYNAKRKRGERRSHTVAYGGY